MVCVYCGNDTKVVNSRHQKRLNRVWRRRNCEVCNSTFTSIEAIDLNGSVSVRIGTALQPFQRDILFLSIHDSLKHRKTAQSDATALTDTVIGHLYPVMQEAVIEKVDIAITTLQILARFDKVAATHYQAFHLS